MNSPTLSRRPGLHQGFTIIELLVVIIVLAILTALMIPAINSSIRESRLQQARAVTQTLSQGAVRINLKQGVTAFTVFDYTTYPVSGDPTEEASRSFSRAAAGAQYLFDQGLIDKLPDTDNVVVLGGEVQPDPDF